MVISSDPLFQEEPYRILTLLFYLISTLWNILCLSDQYCGIYCVYLINTVEYIVFI